MQQPPASEILPILYRAVLDAVADLEVRGYRREAAQVRADATRTYSKAWTQAAARRLQALRSRADRIAEGRRRRRPVLGQRPALKQRPVLDQLERADIGRTPIRGAPG